MDSKLTNEVIDATDDPVDRLLQDKEPESTGKAIAILALLVSFAAVCVSTWLWWHSRQANPDETVYQQVIADLQTAQQQQGDSLATLENQLGTLESPVDVNEFLRRGERLGQGEQRLAAIQGHSVEDQATIAGVQGSVRSLEQRLTVTESGLISVAASNQNSSVELDIAEIDYLLRVANERLQLFADVDAADLALQAADLQIEALDDPIYLSVRQRIATARQALAAVPVVDPIQVSARLNRMQSGIAGLPFRGENVQQAEVVLAEDAGWWQSFKHTMTSLVTVRRRVSEDEAMLSLEDKDYLRQGLWLQLESARLALMRGDATVYINSLDRVGQTIEQFFQLADPDVKGALLETASLKGVNLAPAMPDISAPWTQLRQLRDSRRLLQSAEPLESGDAVE